MSCEHTYKFQPAKTTELRAGYFVVTHWVVHKCTKCGAVEHRTFVKDERFAR